VLVVEAQKVTEGVTESDTVTVPDTVTVEETEPEALAVALTLV